MALASAGLCSALLLAIGRTVHQSVSNGFFVDEMLNSGLFTYAAERWRSTAQVLVLLLGCSFLSVLSRNIARAYLRWR